MDEDYLWRKGALTVPPIQLRNELLRNYLDYVHPFMPLLDFHQFITLMEGGDGATGRISLLLFQAVMFAGSTYVDMRHLNNAGYTTRKTAQKALFQKVKVIDWPSLHIPGTADVVESCFTISNTKLIG